MTTLSDFWFNASYGTVTISSEVEGWYNLGNTEASYGNLATNWLDVIDDAVNLADPDIDFSQYDYVLVWINIPWRGWSSIGSGVSITTDEGTFNVGASLVGEHAPTGMTDTEIAVWGRVAHEMGHAFGLYHTNPNYNSDFSLMARGYPSDLTVFSQGFDGDTGWFDSGNNQRVISSGEPQTDFIVRPRSLNLVGDYQSLKVEISSSLYYLVEVVKTQSEDAWVPDQGVYIYLADGGVTNEACDDQTSPTGVLWDVGETFTDAANSITITIVETVADGYKIRVNNDAGSPDLMITPWGAPPYETPDIWVDSPVNGWDFYRHRDSLGNPVNNGDEPWANHENRLYARIHNVGDVDAHGVVVKFYFTSPIGAGNAVWDYIGETTVDVAKDSFKEIYVPWTPTITVTPGESGIVPVHGCVRVEISPVEEEASQSNNNAQENISFFEIVQSEGGGAGFEPFYFIYRIWNPSEFVNNIYINMIDLSKNWRLENASGIGDLDVFKGSESRDYFLQLVPDREIRFGEDLEAHVVMAYSDWFDDDDFIGDVVLMPISGFSISARTMYRTSIKMSANVDASSVTVSGTLSSLDDLPPSLFPAKGGDRTILLEIINENTGKADSVLVEMDSQGNFQEIFLGLTGARYTITAYYEGTEALTSASAKVSVETSVCALALERIPVLEALLDESNAEIDSLNEELEDTQDTVSDLESQVQELTDNVESQRDLADRWRQYAYYASAIAIILLVMLVYYFRSRTSR
jgi:M6 family metalloprotease-like protein